MRSYPIDPQGGSITTETVVPGSLFKFIDRGPGDELEVLRDRAGDYSFALIQNRVKPDRCKLLVHFTSDALIYLGRNGLVVVNGAALVTVMDVWMIPL